MVRRSFRIGLRLGLLFGVTFALVKTVQSRRTGSSVPPPAPWEPIIDTPRPEPSGAPAVPEPPLVDEVGEPIEEPSSPPPPEEDLLHAKVGPAPDPVLDVVPEPARAEEVSAPVKKVAAKRLPAARQAPAAKKAAKKPTKKAAARPGYVEPEAGTCPPTHPVKAKLASRLFHLPGMFAYDRTRPDRCYVDGPTAVADGFTQAKR